MRSFISLSLVFLAATLSSITQAATLSELTGIPQPNAGNVQLHSRKDFTNAERLARGLPLNPPVRRASGVTAARRAQVSPTPQSTYTGVIQVFSGTNSLGYIAPDPNSFTASLTTDITAALSVTFQLDVGATSGTQLSLTQLNDNRGTYFAPVVGRDSTTSNIGLGSFNYLYLDPVFVATAAGATPQSVQSFYSTSSGLDKQAETSVWSVDLISGSLTAQWINTDGSMPATNFFVQDNFVDATGDVAAFQAQYADPVTAVTLVFVPI